MTAHQGPGQLDEFVNVLAASRLLSDETVQSAMERFHRVRPGRPPGEDLVRAFAAHLVVHGYITPWQSEMLLEGKWKGFYLGDYRLYDYLGHDGTGNRYRAEELPSGEHVVLKIWPYNGKQIEYDVED